MKPITVLAVLSLNASQAASQTITFTGMTSTGAPVTGMVTVSTAPAPTVAPSPLATRCPWPVDGGCASAPAGLTFFPNLFGDATTPGYARQSGQAEYKDDTGAPSAHPTNRNVPGLDYGVGPTIPDNAMQILSATNVPAGCSWMAASAYPMVRCDASKNPVINGWRGYDVLVYSQSDKGGTLTISNSHFTVGPKLCHAASGLGIVTVALPGNNLVATNNKLDFDLSACDPHKANYAAAGIGAYPGFTVLGVQNSMWNVTLHYNVTQSVGLLNMGGAAGCQDVRYNFDEEIGEPAGHTQMTAQQPWAPNPCGPQVTDNVVLYDANAYSQAKAPTAGGTGALTLFATNQAANPGDGSGRQETVGPSDFSRNILIANVGNNPAPREITAASLIRIMGQGFGPYGGIVSQLTMKDNLMDASGSYGCALIEPPVVVTSLIQSGNRTLDGHPVTFANPGWTYCHGNHP